MAGPHCYNYSYVCQGLQIAECRIPHERLQSHQMLAPSYFEYKSGIITLACLFLPLTQRYPYTRIYRAPKPSRFKPSALLEKKWKLYLGEIT